VLWASCVIYSQLFLLLLIDFFDWSDKFGSCYNMSGGGRLKPVQEM